MDKEMDVVLRAMTPEDWPQVAEIYRQGIETGLSTLEAEVPPYEKWNQAHIEGCRIVALIDGEIVGWVVLSPVSGRRVYAGVAEVSIYVSERHRGRKIGEILLKALIEASEEAGFWTLQSGIQDANAPSIALHHKCGFRTVGFRERLGRDKNGRWWNLLLLERRSAKNGME
ncbi:MAG: GNAT family N-acetyltransferase [Synergistaceae bacterium]|jgi:phosphinothricin acetyltransferase|nr:GNAT family N-acetyltransferase [Synergistaceae bacterium]